MISTKQVESSYIRRSSKSSSKSSSKALPGMFRVSPCCFQLDGLFFFFPPRNGLQWTAKLGGCDGVGCFILLP
jgi:hypothetical protein